MLVRGLRLRPVDERGLARGLTLVAPREGEVVERAQRMLVGGVPEASTDHAARVAEAAIAMRDHVAALSQRRALGISMRIGIHSGEVVAGVIGRRKFSFDLWGDTVNTASRMESHGSPGRIHVSDTTRELLAGAYEVVERGVVTIKGKGDMRTHWLEARRAPDQRATSPR